MITNILIKGTTEKANLFNNKLFASAEPKRETEKAALYDIMFTPDFEGSISVGYDIWVPKSQIEVKGNNLCLSKWAVINCLLPVYNRHN